MLTVPVLIAIAVGVCMAVGIGLWLSSRPSPTDPGYSPQEPPFQKDEPCEDVEDKTSPKPDPVGLTLQDLCSRLDLPQQQLVDHEASYRIAQITKPRGGMRRLEIPDDATKLLQKRILKRLLHAIDAHPLACGFEEGASIVDAAIPHQNKSVVVKMDVRKFFETTSSERIQKWFSAIGWDDEASAVLTKLTTHSGHLPQGAPTSPRLSNLVNSPLDHALLQLARKHKGHYSRYADDITMSFDIAKGRKIRGLTQVVRRILRSYGYSMHGGKKLKIFRQNQQQKVLGLVVNSKVALPRSTRRWLRSVRHRFDQGKETTITESQLLGWESLAHMVETQREE